MIIILTEVGRAVGLGHLTRMRSLKQQLNADGYETRMVVQVEEEGAGSTLQMGQCETASHWINDSETLHSLISRNDIVVVDTYGTTERFMEEISSACARLVAIDDYNRIRYENCIVVNPNFYGAFIDYPTDNNCDYRLGARYTLLRPEFCVLGARAIKETVERILITFGGTDVMGLTAKTVRYCHSIAPGAGLEIVVTSSFSDVESVQAALVEADTLHCNLSAAQMNELMNHADFAIASAGSTSNELMKTQCPSILIKVAENQADTMKYLEPLGYFRSFDVDSFEKINQMLDPKVRKSIHDKLLELETKSSAKDLVEEVYDKLAEG